MVIALLVGLALASVHWLGLFLGGAIVGWTWPTTGRATVAGAGFGLGVLLTFGITLALADVLDMALTLGPITPLTIGMALFLGTLGGLSRGLARNAPESVAE